MRFDEKLDISDMVRCVANYGKTLSIAMEFEAKKTEARNALNGSDGDAGSCGKDNANGKCNGESDNGKIDAASMYEFARLAVIQAYQITVDSAWKLMQRWIKINADQNIAQKPKRELFRIARDSGLIADAESWWGFYDGRNKTSHTYHEAVAEEVYAMAKAFKSHLEDFLRRIGERR